MKKTVKINYAGVSEDFNKKGNLIYDILVNQGYDVQISEDPDYIICDTIYPGTYDYCAHPQIRIQYSGENYIPDLNLIDYAISPYPLTLGDRHFQLPACVWPREHWMDVAKRDRSGITMEFVKSKEYFANFISSHESEYNIRGDFFKKLNEYKRVEAPGTYLNNMPDGKSVNWLNDSKTEFQRKCKFTLCFESTCHYGFVTEKIMEAFYADTIPVYFGSPTVTEIFNKDAFVNCGDFDTFDAAIERIRELDQDDAQYLQMLRQPILVDPDYPDRLEKELGEFVCHIFDQPIQQAYRRSRVYLPKQINDYLSRAVDSETLTMGNLLGRMAEKVKGKMHL